MASDQHQSPLATRQRTAVAEFNRARQEAERALLAVNESRESRMDAGHRLEVLRREHAALTTCIRARAHATALAGDGPPRAVVAHRHPWFSQALVALLQAAGAAVVEHGLENGADAVGVAVAEQPELFLVEDGLLMVSGDEVVRDTRRFCLQTVIAVHTPNGGRRDLLLEAGADAVTLRPVPPAEVVEKALAVLPRR
jgi:CheY-like chemotaxis protein